MAVRAVLGTMTFGPNGQTSPEDALVQLKTYSANAAAAITTGPGQQAVGQVLIDTARGCKVATACVSPVNRDRVAATLTKCPACGPSSQPALWFGGRLRLAN